MLNNELIARAVEIIRRGGVIAFPTETVYALAGDANSAQALMRIYTLKKRIATSPMAILVKDLKTAEQIAVFNDLAYKLGHKFCPGPLTLILPAQKDAAIVRTAGDNIGIRIPSHLIAQQILQALNIPLIGTSANLSGEPSALCADQVRQYFDNQLDLIINESDIIGVEASTIVDLTVSPPRILRVGAILPAEIMAALD
jgi:L-threonylcarbamoyladenylate synthase